jgi:hypothetical protein
MNYRRISRIFLGSWLALACARRAIVTPISDASMRFVELPSRAAVLGASHSVTGLPGEVTFGSSRGRSALYLQFAPAWREHGAPLQAFLVLEPRSGAPVDPTPVSVQVWRVRSPWQPDAVHDWSDKPELALPHASAVISSSPARPLRIDVTELLRFAANNPGLDHGLALIASGGAAQGATFATGMSGDAAPHLEIYTREHAPSR